MLEVAIMINNYVLKKQITFQYLGFPDPKCADPEHFIDPHVVTIVLKKFHVIKIKIAGEIVWDSISSKLQHKLEQLPQQKE